VLSLLDPPPPPAKKASEDEEEDEEEDEKEEEKEEEAGEGWQGIPGNSRCQAYLIEAAEKSRARN
jgi:hypothetical protein